ncbi:MAG: Hpt domain-containing protein [Planctomycetes bacterium]|nr:Hpt domain-containing protein [Planctomycetota bacterium]
MTDPNNTPILSDLDNDPDLWKFAEQFIDKMPDLLERINTALAQVQSELLKERIQHFKTAAVHGGFAPLADQADQITQLTASDQSEQIQSAIDQLNQLCQRVPTH